MTPYMVRLRLKDKGYTPHLTANHYFLIDRLNKGKIYTDIPTSDTLASAIIALFGQRTLFDQ